MIELKCYFSISVFDTLDDASIIRRLKSVLLPSYDTQVIDRVRIE